MKALISLSIFAAVFISCMSLPQIKPFDPGANDKLYKKSGFPFLKQKCRLIHSINAELPDGSVNSIIGITVADPDSKILHAVIMTIEGIVLFEAVNANKEIIIKRSIPPFDSMDFAKGLMDDITLILFRPETRPYESGILRDSAFAFRYKKDNSMIIDVITDQNGIREISLYSKCYRLQRTVKAFSINEKGLPANIELTAHGFLGYSLHLKLLEFDLLSPK